jgi:hypothetical protein
MKTERRHELQTNLLADKMAHWISLAEPYSQMILAGIVAVVVLVFALIYMSSRQTQQLAVGWDQYFLALRASDEPKLVDVARENPRTSVAEWSRLMAADLLLARSIGQLFTDKADARQEINKAVELYKTVYEGTAEVAILERAQFGLARAYESLGELQKAKVPYKAVATNGGPYAGMAKERLEDLGRTEEKEFYDWLAKYEPPRPTDKPDKKPDFLNDSLENPSVLQLPSSITDRLPSAGPVMPATGDQAAPAGEKPAAESTPPAEAEKPADGKTPATEKTPAEPAAKAADGAPAAAPAEKAPAATPADKAATDKAAPAEKAADPAAK